MKRILSAMLAVFMILTAIPFCNLSNNAFGSVSASAATAATYKVTLDNCGATTAGTSAYWYMYKTVKNGVYYYLDRQCTTAMPDYTITVPTKTGYTFKGYYTFRNGLGTQYVDENGKCINNIYKLLGSRTLYAYWVANTYKVTLDNGGATAEGTTAYWYKYKTVVNGTYYFLDSDCTMATENSTIICPKKNGFDFKGYFTEPNGAGTQYVDENGKCINNIYKTAGDVTLYAKWERSYDGRIIYDKETQSITVKNSNGKDTGLFGYKYSLKDHIFYTGEDSWQRNFGFSEIYDKAAAIGTMTYNTIRVRFNYNNEEWMLQFWKGQYGLFFIGAEVGVYTRPVGSIGTFYNCADDNHKLWMTMDLYRQKTFNKNKYSHVFTRSRCQTWWCTGFVLGSLGLGQLNVQDLNGTAKLKVDTRIEFYDSEMAKAFIDSLVKIDYIENNAALAGTKREIHFNEYKTEKEYDASSASCKYLLCKDGKTVRVCYR